MSRNRRIDFPGARHHVMNRGGRRHPIFFNDEDCSRFLLLVEEAVNRFQIRVAAYVLMENHYHLLVESVRGNLSAAMRYLSQGYTQHTNFAMGCDGPIFRGRFKSKLVVDESHWHYLPIYLHMNPVRAQMVTHASQYVWSSQQVYVGVVSAPSWLSPWDLLESYGGPIGYRESLDEILQGREKQPVEFESVLFDNRGPTDSSRPRTSEGARRRTAQKALEEVSAITGASLEDLVRSERGRKGNEPRALAA